MNPLIYALLTVVSLLLVYNAIDYFRSERANPVAVQEEYYDLLLENKFGYWIPIREASPEVSGYYLVTVSAKAREKMYRGIPDITNVTMDRYNSTLDRWEYFNGYVVAWMVPPNGYRNV